MSDDLSEAREAALRAFKEAVSSGTSGVGNATYGGAGEPEEDEDEEVEEKIAEKALVVLDKEWVEDPSEQAETMRWRNTETGEYRYQQEKPGQEGSGEETGDGDGGDSGGFDVQVDSSQDLREIRERITEQTGSDPSRDDVQQLLGVEDIDWDEYEEFGIDSFDLSTAVGAANSPIDEYSTLEEFEEAAASGELGDKIKDGYSIFSDPADLEDIPEEVRDSILADARQRFVEETVMDPDEEFLEETTEPEIPTADEGDGEDAEEGEVDYSEQYPGMAYHEVGMDDVEEGDYLVVDRGDGPEKIRVRNVGDVVEGITQNGRSTGATEDDEILARLPDGDAYQNEADQAVQSVIEEHEETVESALSEFQTSDFRRNSEEVQAMADDEFQRLDSSMAMSLRSAITDAVSDGEAVDEIWARMNEMKQSSTGRQRAYIDQLASQTFGLEADEYGEEDYDFDFDEADEEAMAVVAGVSQQVVDTLSDGEVYRGVGEYGTSQMVEAWLSEPMNPEMSFEERATANYSDSQDVARTFGDFTVKKEAGSGNILNGQDLMRGMYRASAAADEAEIWTTGNKQSVSAWDISVGHKRKPGGERKSITLGEYQKPIEEIEDEDFLHQMGRTLRDVANSDNPPSLSGEAAENARTLAERIEEVTGNEGYQEIVEGLTVDSDEKAKNVVDLTDESEAGWLDSLRGEKRAASEMAEKALSVVEKEWVKDPSENANTMRWRNTETGEYRYQENKPGEGGGESSSQSDSDDQRQEMVDIALDNLKNADVAAGLSDEGVEQFHETLGEQVPKVRDPKVAVSITDGLEIGDEVSDAGGVHAYSTDGGYHIIRSASADNPEPGMLRHEFGHAIHKALGLMAGTNRVNRVAHSYSAGGYAKFPNFDEWEFGGEWAGKGDLPEFGDFLLHDEESGVVPGGGVARQERAVFSAEAEAFEFNEAPDDEQEQIEMLKSLDRGEIISYTGHHGDEKIAMYEGEGESILDGDLYDLTVLYERDEDGEWVMPSGGSANDGLRIDEDMFSGNEKFQFDGSLQGVLDRTQTVENIDIDTGGGGFSPGGGEEAGLDPDDIPRLENGLPDPNRMTTEQARWGFAREINKRWARNVGNIEAGREDAANALSQSKYATTNPHETVAELTQTMQDPDSSFGSHASIAKQDPELIAFYLAIIEAEGGVLEDISEILEELGDFL